MKEKISPIINFLSLLDELKLTMREKTLQGAKRIRVRVIIHPLNQERTLAESPL